MTITAEKKLAIGYKQTEIGAIPVNWSAKRLEDLCIEKGLVRGPFGGALKKEYFVDRGIKVYEQKNAIYKSFELGDYFIDNNKYTELKRFDLKPNDFIVSCSGTIGKIYLIPANAPRGIINQALLKITTDDKVVVKEYFLHYFEWEKFQERIIDNTQGGAMKNLVGMSVFRETLIPVPSSISEQKAIASALSDVNSLIGKLSSLINKKKFIKRGVMQELLTGKKRLPGFNYKWETKKLGELLDYEQPTQYLVKHTDYSDDHDIPVLTAGKTFILGYTAEETGVFQNLPTIIFDDFTTAIKYVDFPFKAKSSAMKMLIPRNREVNLKFVFAKMQLIDFQLGDHKRYWISEYQNIEIATPKSDEQTAIASVLSDMDAEIEKLELQLTKYRNIKQGMMQTLLTGKIRLLTK